MGTGVNRVIAIAVAIIAVSGCTSITRETSIPGISHETVPAPDIYPNLRAKITTAPTGYCPSRECLIDLAVVIPGDWDHLYIFGSSESDAHISQVIAQPYTSRTPNTSKYLLLKDGVIVHWEEDEPQYCTAEFCSAYFWATSCLSIDRQHSTVKKILPAQIQMRIDTVYSPTDVASQTCSTRLEPEWF